MNDIIDCPYCDGKANLQKEAKEITYRKEFYKIIAHYYKCTKCKEEFTTTEADALSLTQVHNQYREKYNIPFPNEIVAIRHKYDLSASKMSEVLGLGTNGYSNYENGEIPVPAYGNLINAAADPRFFLKLLDNAKEHFSENTFRKVRERVECLITDERNQHLCARLNFYNEANNFTGYRKPDPAKISSVLTYYLQNSTIEFNDKLKLNKLLFFTDFTHYKNYGNSICGLSYRAVKYGPVPTNYDNIYAYLESEQLINTQFLKLPSGGARETFYSETSFDIGLFTEQEVATLKLVNEKFKNISTWDIVELSHQEKSWKELEAKKAIIGYQDYAFELNAL